MKKLFFTAICLLMSLSGMAQTESTVKCYVNDFSIKPGETKDLIVNLDNPDNKFTGFQFDMQLPAGVEVYYDDDEEEYVASIAENRKNEGHALRASKTDEKTYTFVAFSSGNKNLQLSEGPLVIIPVVAASDAATGEFTGKILNAKFTPKKGSSVVFQEIPFKVTIGDGTDGINSIQAAGTKATMYNVAGQRVENPAKGIFIQNGKKVVIK